RFSTEAAIAILELSGPRSRPHERAEGFEPPSVKRESQRSVPPKTPKRIKALDTVATVDSLWLYPVKGMRVEALCEAVVGFSGLYGDRYFAFKCTTRPRGFPYLTASQQSRLLQFRPRFRDPARAARPTNLAEAEALAPGLTPVYADPADMVVDVET